MNAIKFAAAAILASSALTGAAVARDQVQIAGSSTVLPYASIVAEAFGENFEFPTPVVESGGSGAGRKKLCEGVGENTIDIANSSSRIKQSDIDLCASNGVTEIQEVRIGYDGIVFASDINGPEFAFTPSDWHNALAAKVLKDGQLVDNPYKTWNESAPIFPSRKSWPSFLAPSTAPAKSSTRR
jgi:phosphate transport system substrate-binding protein